MKNLGILAICIAVTLIGLMIFTEYDGTQSVSRLFGYPIVSFADKAEGVIAVGGRAIGVIAVGGAGFGVIAIGMFAAGILFGIAQFGVGFLFYLGQFGIGLAFCLAQFGLGVQTLSMASFHKTKMDRLKELNKELGELFAFPFKRKTAR